MNSIFNYYPELKEFFPYTKKFGTDNFKKTFEDSYTLSHSQKSNIDDYEDFKNLIYKNLGKNYYPIMRVSDGEMLLLTSFQNESRRANYKKRLIVFLKNIIKKIFYNKDKLISSHIFGNFDHATGTSETYNFKPRNFTKTETEKIQQKFIDELRFISNNGILAIHYSYSQKPSMVERYWIKFNRALKNNDIHFDENNCFPFYFVYMFLSEENSLNKIVHQKKILCASSATKSKKDNIINKLNKHHPAEIDWLPLPTSKTFFHDINLEDKDLIKNYDVIFLAAGTGKTNIIKQLAVYECPIIE